MTKLSTTPRLEDAPCLTEAECLLIDPRADQDALFDQAESRLEAASNLMFTLCQMDTPGASADARDLANVAIASRFLLADSLDLIMAARKVAKRHQAPARKWGAHG